MVILALVVGALLFALPAEAQVFRTLAWDPPASTPVSVDAYRVRVDGVELTVTAAVAWQVDVGDYAPHTYAVTSLHWELNGVETESASVTVVYQEPKPPPAPPPQSSFIGVPHPIPGLIETENFDVGGSGVAYADSDAINAGGAYRTTESVDLQGASEGGYNVGWIVGGEWLEYTVAVAASGTYTLNVRVASQGQGGPFHVEVDGADVSGPMAIPDTGGWQSWTTLTRPVTLTAGTHVLRLSFDAAPGYVGNVNWLQFSTGVPPPPECSYAIAPSSASVGASGGTGSVAVTPSAATCAWTASSEASWATITSGASGVGPGSVGYSVAANLGSARTAALSVAGQTFALAQGGYTPPPSGCYYQGTLYALGYRLPAMTMRNRDVDAFLASVRPAGWVVATSARKQGWTTFVLECRP